MYSRDVQHVWMGWSGTPCLAPPAFTPPAAPAFTPPATHAFPASHVVAACRRRMSSTYVFLMSHVVAACRRRMPSPCRMSSRHVVAACRRCEWRHRRATLSLRTSSRWSADTVAGADAGEGCRTRPQQRYGRTAPWSKPGRAAGSGDGAARVESEADAAREERRARGQAHARELVGCGPQGRVARGGGGHGGQGGWTTFAAQRP